MSNSFKLQALSPSLAHPGELETLLLAAAAGDMVALARLRLLNLDAAQLLATLGGEGSAAQSLSKAAGVSSASAAGTTWTAQATSAATPTFSAVALQARKDASTASVPMSGLKLQSARKASSAVPSMAGLTLQSASAPAGANSSPQTPRGLQISTEPLDSGNLPVARATPPSPRSNDVTTPIEIGHMAYFPRAASVAGPRTPRWIDRAPVYVDGKGTSMLAVAGATDIIAALTGASGLDLAVTLFSGSGALKTSIRGKRLTSLKGRIVALYQDDYMGGGTSGNPPDLHMGEQLESILSRLVVTLYTAVNLSPTREAGPPASCRSHGSLPCGSD